MQHPKKRTDPRTAERISDSVPVRIKPRILVAEDDYEMCRLIASTLRRAGYRVKMCANGINLLNNLGAYLLDEEGERYALIISDIRMPGVTGMEILAGLSPVEDAPPIILITAFGDAKTHFEAARLGAIAVLDKPFEMDTLLNLVRETLQD